MSVFKCHVCDYEDSEIVYLDHHIITQHKELLNLQLQGLEKIFKIPTVTCRNFSPFNVFRAEKYYLGSFINIFPKVPTKKYQNIVVNKIKVKRGCRFCLKARKDPRLQPKDIVRAHEMVYKCIQNKNNCAKNESCVLCGSNQEENTSLKLHKEMVWCFQKWTFRRRNPDLQVLKRKLCINAKDPNNEFPWPT